MKKIIALLSRLVNLYRGRENFGCAPTIFDSTVNLVSRDANLSCPLSHRKAISTIFQKHITAFIIFLGFFGCPAAIVFGITCFIINSINSKTIGAFSHVAQKILKRIDPLFTNRNSTVEVILSLFRICGYAAHFHAVPSSVFPRAFRTSRVAVRDGRRKPSFLLKAATRFNMASRDFILRDMGRVSAGTETFPNRVAIAINRSLSYYLQSVMNLTRNVVKLFFHEPIINIKLLACIVLVTGICIRSNGQQLTAGENFVDGQRVTAAELMQLVNQAIINPAFYSGQVAANTNLQANDLLLVLSGTGTYHKLFGSQVINNPLIFTSQPIQSTIPPYATLLYYDPTNNNLNQITATNFATAESSNLQVNLFQYARTNSTSANALVPVLATYTNTPNIFSTNNQNQFITWDTNGAPYSLTLSNLIVSVLSPLGTNLFQPWIYTNVFLPQTFGITNATSNFWGSNIVYPITNLFFTNALIPTNSPTVTNAQTLTNSDLIPILAASQTSNTTFTLEALYEYLTNRNTLPAYALARAQFRGIPFTLNITNVNTSLHYFFATNNGLTELQTVSFQFASDSSTILPSTPQVVSNTPYYVHLIGNGSNFMLFTNYADAVTVNTGQEIVPTGTASVTPGQNILLYCTNFTAFNADAIALCTGTAVRTGTYDVCFRTPLTTAFYYLSGAVQQAADNSSVPLCASFDAVWTTNKIRIQTSRASVGLENEPRLSVLLQPQ